jgi:hypothetical protein
MKRFLAALLVCATAAVAQTSGPFDYTSSDGTIYGLGNTYLGDIFVFPRESIDDAYLLLRDCTARHEDFGTGHWQYANSDWLIEYPDFRIVFPNQEPPPVDTKRCGLT